MSIETGGGDVAAVVTARPSAEVASAIRVACQRLFAAEPQFVARFTTSLLHLVPALRADELQGRSMAEGLGRAVLWAALTEDSDEVVEGTFENIGSDYALQGFPADGYQGVGHALLRAARDTYTADWTSELSSGWVAYYSWLCAHLQRGALPALLRGAASAHPGATPHRDPVQDRYAVPSPQDALDAAWGDSPAWPRDDDLPRVSGAPLRQAELSESGADSFRLPEAVAPEPTDPTPAAEPFWTEPPWPTAPRPAAAVRRADTPAALTLERPVGHAQERSGRPAPPTQVTSTEVSLRSRPSQPGLDTGPRTLDDVLDQLQARYFVDNERSLGAIVTRVALRTGADLRAPRPDQRDNQAVIANVLAVLQVMGYVMQPSDEKVQVVVTPGERPRGQARWWNRTGDGGPKGWRRAMPGLFR